MKTTSSARTVSRIRFATVVLPEPVPPQMPMIMIVMVINGAYGTNESYGTYKSHRYHKSYRSNVTSRQFRDYPSQQFRELTTYAFAGSDDLVMIDGPIRNAGREIRNAGKA